jgi:hypothetical protein
MHEGKITVTIYPTSKQRFSCQGIYGDHILVIYSGRHISGTLTKF